MQYFTLNNGVKMPSIGLGVFQIPKEDTEKCVIEALKAGYRLIDTAAYYGNEKEVGDGIKNSGIPREEIFVTTKLWICDQGYERAKRAFERSLKNLQVDYIDLFLIHQPFGDIYGSWRAMEELYQEGKIRAIGVSNFTPDRLTDLILNNKVVPAVNQIENHPFDQKEDEVLFNKQYNIQVESWGSLARGAFNIFENELLKKIGDRHNKSISQVVLRWEYQRGIVTIPKTTNVNRMKENIDIFDFELNDDEMGEISKLNTVPPGFSKHRDPENVKRIINFPFPFPGN